MKKIKNFIICMFLLIFLVACVPEGTINSNIKNISDVGNIITAFQIFTSWNERTKMQVVTDNYIFIVDGNHSVKIGSDMQLIEYENGQKCIMVKDNTDPNSENCWIIYK